MPWQYDPNLSKVEWAIGYLGIATVKGQFKKLQAALNLDDPDPSKWSVEATIEAASLSSDYDPMDDHVRSADFLDVERYPTITFRSTLVERANGHYRIAGDLTLHGVTQEIVLRATYGGEATDSRGRTRRGFSAHTSLKRSAFAIPSTMSGERFVAGEDVRITLEIIANKVEIISS
ncbi:MAG: polyisoprenoid-binding protein [Chloroflexi bacterium]|nr:polyisoprenoid-binding protein [Chloroflexota bacterium]